jgi:hypothetical protein
MCGLLAQSGFYVPRAVVDGTDLSELDGPARVDLQTSSSSIAASRTPSSTSTTSSPSPSKAPKPSTLATSSSAHSLTASITTNSDHATAKQNMEMSAFETALPELLRASLLEGTPLACFLSSDCDLPEAMLPDMHGGFNPAAASTLDTAEFQRDVCSGYWQLGRVLERMGKTTESQRAFELAEAGSFQSWVEAHATFWEAIEDSDDETDEAKPEEADIDLEVEEDEESEEDEEGKADD